MRLPLPFIALLLLAKPTLAQEPFSLHIPIACAVGTECFIQNYADLDPTPDYHDHRCGRLTYNQHDGIDFRLRNFKAMQDGVAVLAAAEGMVTAFRDGMRDVSVKEGGKEAIRGRDCGNGVVIRHRQGWETQYCHMQQGSLTVQRGQTVKAGDKLGLVGLSGNTEFPHLHLTVRHGQETLDPFTGRSIPLDSQASASYVCGETSETGSLWSVRAKSSLVYIPTALLGIGFSNEAPDVQDARQGKYENIAIARAAPVLAFWVDIMGIQPGDTLTLQLLSPTGETIAVNTQTIDASKAQQFDFIGDRFPQSIRPGNYTGKATLRRKGHAAPVIEETRKVTVK